MPPHETHALPDPAPAAFAMGSGAIWGYRFDGEGHAHALTEPGRADCEAPANDWVWLHFPLSDNRARLFIERLDFLPRAARTLILGEDWRVQMHAQDGWTFGVAPDLERDLEGRALDFARLAFAMDSRRLITARRHALTIVDRVRREVDEGRPLASPPDGFVRLIERFIDAVEARAHSHAAALDHVEDQVLSNAGGLDRLPIGPVRRELSRCHRELAGLRTAFHRLDGHRSGAGAPHLLRDRLPALTQEIEDFDREAAGLQDRARLLYEEIDSKITSATNRSLRTLTVLTSLMMPPTLIVGAFGMNLEGIPWAQHPIGFTFACALCIAAVAGTALALRRMRIF